MKHLHLSILRKILLSLFCFGLCFSSRASHILGGGLTYRLVADSTYELTLTLYTNCGIESSSANSALQTLAPDFSVFNGSALIVTDSMHIDNVASGTEIYNTCVPPLLSQCSDMNSPVPGTRKYVYKGHYTLPYSSGNWRFVYCGTNGYSTCMYTYTLTNIVSGLGDGAVYYEAKLSTSQNSSPVVSGGEQPYYCVLSNNLYDISANDPDGDSLSFALTPVLMNYNASFNTFSCGDGGAVEYVTPNTPAHPIMVSSFNYNNATGNISFTPSTLQRSMIAYTISEYRAGVLVGTSQHNMTLTILNCSDVCTAGINDPTPEDIELYPNPAHDELTVSFTRTGYTTATITDISGRILVTTPINSRQQVIDTKGLMPGLYYLLLKSDNGMAVKRVTIAP